MSPAVNGRNTFTSHRNAVLSALVVIVGALLLITAFEYGPGGEKKVVRVFQGGVSSVTFLSSYSPTLLRVDLKGADHVKKAVLHVRGVLPPNSTFIPVGLRPVSLADGDFNGDGFPDVAAACYDEGSLYVLLNRGEGEIDFFTPAVYQIGEYPIKVVAGDLDGDGDLDLALLGESGWLKVMLGRGDGTFEMARGNTTAGRNPKDLICADLDGDGAEEILTVNEVGDSLKIFRLNGTLPEFVAKMEVEGDPQALTAGDVNGDGRVDLVVVNRADRDAVIFVDGEERRYFFTLSLFLGVEGGYEHVGDWTIGKGPSDVALADVDGDGDLDAVASARAGRSLSLLLNSGGTFERGLGGWLDSLQYVSSDPVEMRVGDVNSDGRADVLTVNSANNSVEVFFGAPDGLKEAKTYYIGSSPVSISIQDYDGDGDEDVIVGNHNEPHEGDGYATISTMENFFYGVFLPVNYYPVGASPRGIYTSDIDNDGHVDIGTANYFGSTVSVIYGNGVGGFSLPQYVPIGLEPYSVVMVDLNGDGMKDIASADEARNVVIVVLNEGNRSFSGERPAYYVEGYPIAMISADVDGDGDQDLLTANHGQKAICILYNSGNGSFPRSKIISLGDSMPFDIATGDLNGDGLLDIVTANIGSEKYYGDNITVIFQKSGGEFTSPVKYKVGTAPSSVSLADMDGDGDLDVVVCNMRSDSVQVLFNDGEGSLSNGWNVSVGIMPQTSMPLDVNGDGMVDLIVTNTGSNDISLLLNTGSGLRTLYRTPAGSYPYMMAAGDFNGDGMVDLAYTNVNVNNVGVLLSLYYPKDVVVDVGYDLKVDERLDGYLTGEMEMDLTSAFNEYLKRGSLIPVAISSGGAGLIEVSLEVIAD